MTFSSDIAKLAFYSYGAAAVAQSVRAFVSHKESWLFEFQPQRTQDFKTGCDI